MSDHVDTMEDADGYFFVYCDYCECLVEQSKFDV